MAKSESETKVRPVTSILGEPVNVFYGPDDLGDFDYQEQLNDPGQYPFTRGVRIPRFGDTLYPPAVGFAWTIHCRNRFCSFFHPADNRRF